MLGGIPDVTTPRPTWPPVLGTRPFASSLPALYRGAYSCRYGSHALIKRWQPNKNVFPCLILHGFVVAPKNNIFITSVMLVEDTGFVLDQINPVHTQIHCFIQINFNVILLVIPGSYQAFRLKFCLHFSSPHVC